MLNLFALWTAYPREMKVASEPIGELNDLALTTVVPACDQIICCWSSHGSYLSRDLVVRSLIQSEGIELWHLGLTKNGQPKHPMYLRADTQRIRWE